jgi:OHCU decarboxylase
METLSVFDGLTSAARIRIRLAALNDCSPETAYFQFRRCCGSSAWAGQMADARPFAGLPELEERADRVWASCSSSDWLEAFAAHPRIGEQSGSVWSRQEQSGTSGALLQIREAFTRASREYERKFGFLFIICATGKSLPEMLSELEKRLTNGADRELYVAAEEQLRITRLRLRKLVSE